MESFGRKYFDSKDLASLGETFTSISEATGKWNSVVVGLDHSIFTIIPGSLYDRSHWFDYLLCVYPDLTLDEVCSIPVLEERFIFQFDIQLRKLLSDHFPGFMLFHLAAAYWIYYTDNPVKEDHLYLMLRDNHLYLLSGQDQRITLLNRFYAPTENDALYYCLLACKEFNRSPNDVTISITSNKPEIILRFEKYFKEVVVRDPITENLNLSESVDPLDLMDHFYLYYANNRREVQRSSFPPTN